MGFVCARGAECAFFVFIIIIICARTLTHFLRCAGVLWSQTLASLLRPENPLQYLADFILSKNVVNGASSSSSASTPAADKD